jgi:hypothetical protein
MKMILLPVCLLFLSPGIILISGCGNNSKKSEQQVENTSADKQSKDETQAKNGSSENVKKEKVIMNGITWDDKMESEFQNIYKIKPIPGNYWYDSTSGLWGLNGGQALGFIYPGHAYGTMQSNISNGNSGIFINGRHIPVSEALIWGQILGSPAQPGRYWLDGLGNVGYEGIPYTAFNLYVVATQNNYRRGSSGGGDNFWSTRFSAGNSSADGSTGYVSIPGQGVIASYGD